MATGSRLVPLVALVAAALPATAPAGDADQTCRALGTIMVAIAKARDAGMSRPQAYDAIAESFRPGALRTFGRLAVDRAYDCPKCSAEHLARAMVDLCHDTVGEDTRDKQAL